MHDTRPDPTAHDPTAPRGNATCEKLANGLYVLREFHSTTGMIESIEAGEGSCSRITHHVQNESYTFDNVGNLTNRQRDFWFDSNQILIDELYEYDDFDRLNTQTAMIGALEGPSQSYQYDLLGRITSMPGDAGSRDYGNQENWGSGPNERCDFKPGPHAVTRVGEVRYCYDRNGNQTRNSQGRVIHYTPFDKPSLIEYDNTSAATKRGRATTFAYDASRNHVLRIDRRSANGTAVRTITFGGIEVVYEEQPLTEVDVTVRRHLAGHINQEMRGKINRNNGQLSGLSVSENRFSLSDYQGSVVAYTNGEGQLIEQMRYSPFGKNWRLPTSQSDVAPPVLPLIDATNQEIRFGSRGYTGHEQIANFGLIHMGGRLYDPTLGRFLSADPFIQAPENSQNLDRYSYVLNNPMSYTDPSGYLFKKIGSWIKDNWRSLASIAISIFLPAAGFMVNAFGGASGLVSGALAGYVGSGSLEGALLGAFSALGHGLAGGIEHGWGNVLANGVVGGLAAVPTGRGFGHGFRAAGASAFAKHAFEINDIGDGKESHRPHRIAAAAAVGGTVSTATGGKFANGAVTAAFVQAYNGEEDILEEMRRRREVLNAVQQDAGIKRAIAALQELGKGMGRNDPVKAYLSLDLENRAEIAKLYGHEINVATARGATITGMDSVVGFEIRRDEMMRRSDLIGRAGRGFTEEALIQFGTRGIGRYLSSQGFRKTDVRLIQFNIDNAAREMVRGD